MLEDSAFELFESFVGYRSPEASHKGSPDSFSSHCRSSLSIFAGSTEAHEEEEETAPLSAAFSSSSSCFTGWPGLCMYKREDSEGALKRCEDVRKREVHSFLCTYVAFLGAFISYT